MVNWQSLSALDFWAMRCSLVGSSLLCMNVCPCDAVVVVVMAFPPVALHAFTGNMPPSDFLNRFSCSCFIITCSTYSLLWKTIQDLPSCRLFPMSSMPCFTTPKQFYDTCHARHRMRASKRGTLSSIISRLNHFNFRLRPVGLFPSCLTFEVTSAYPMVVDLRCQSGTFTRWNYRPYSAAHLLGSECLLFCLQLR